MRAKVKAQEGQILVVELENGGKMTIKIEFPSVWTNIHTYRRFKATRRGLRASMSPGSTLSPHNLSERLTNALRAYFFGGFLSFPTWNKNKYNTPRPVVKGKKLDVCLYKTTRSDTGFKDRAVDLRGRDVFLVREGGIFPTVQLSIKHAWKRCF